MAFSKVQCNSTWLVSLYTPFYRLVPSGDASIIVGNNRSMYDKRLIESVVSSFQKPTDLQHDLSVANSKSANTSVVKLLIGHGPGSNSLSANYASWTAEIYDTGVTSVVIMLLFYLYILLVAFRRNGLGYSLFLPCFIVPSVLSFYQRPEVISPMIIIFWIVISRTLRDVRSLDKGI